MFQTIRKMLSPTCPLCGGRPMKIIHGGVPMRICGECFCIWGGWSWWLWVIPFTGWLYVYRGSYWLALWRWLFLDGEEE